jgi:hypothetical protein
MLFSVLGFLLLLLNFAAIYFLRTSRSFAIFPGWIYTVLFLCFGSYLLYLLSTYTPLGPVPPRVAAKRPSHGAIVTPNKKAENKYLSKYSASEKVFLQAKSDREEKFKEDKDTINIFLNYLILQSVYAFVASLVGSRVVRVKANYYFSFAGLFMFLTLAAVATKYLINRNA